MSITDKIKDDLDKAIKACNSSNYPQESLVGIQERALANTKKMMNTPKGTIEENDWVQVHSGGEEPFYAKVKSITGEHAQLYGVYNYDKKFNRTQLALPLNTMLPLSPSLGAELEYANGNNKKVTELYLRRGPKND